MDNVYYSPEKWGLEVVAETDYSDGDYVFDKRVVWRDVETKVFYTARSSGCSCPVPFEDFTSKAELDRLDMYALETEVLAQGQMLMDTFLVAVRAAAYGPWYR